MVAPTPALAVHDLEFRWAGGADFVLRLPTLTLHRGCSLFLHGPSGSGKSTLLNLIGGVLLPTKGKVELLGQPLGGLSARRCDAFRADHLGFVFQQFNLLPYLSVLDNVLLPCRFSARRARQARDPRAEARRLLGALDLDPGLLGRPAAELSVGQQQRVAAARALIGQPEILMADEPTSALDAERQAAFVTLLLSEARRAGSTVVFVSHDIRLASHFDHLMALDP